MYVVLNRNGIIQGRLSSPLPLPKQFVVQPLEQFWPLLYDTNKPQRNARKEWYKQLPVFKFDPLEPIIN